MGDNQQQAMPPQQAPPVIEPKVSPADVLTPQEPSKKGNKVIWFLGLLSILVLLVVAYLAYQNNQLRKELKMVMLNNAATETQALISPTEATTPTPDPTAGWEIYQDSVASFAFPPDWIARKSPLEEDKYIVTVSSENPATENLFPEIQISTNTATDANGQLFKLSSIEQAKLYYSQSFDPSTLEVREKYLINEKSMD